MPKREISNNQAVNKVNIGNRLKMLRSEVHMTQEQVANYLNINRSTYTKYETGNTEMCYSLIVKLARLFKVDFNKLLCYDLLD